MKLSDSYKSVKGGSLLIVFCCYISYYTLAKVGLTNVE